jgi:hypothetical protein
LNRSRIGLVVAGWFLMIVGSGAVAHAQATRTWVSGVGDDANPCSRTAPCKTFAGAITKTAAGGEINCIDPGGFGALTITKAITVDCAVGSILSSGTIGIIINATAAADVTIRNLRINGAGTGTIGIDIRAARAVYLDHVTIVNHTTAGVQSRAAAATVQNSSFASNATAVLQNAAGSNINIANTSFANNTTALQSVAGSTIRVSGSVLANNSTAFNANGGSILSDGQNAMLGNGANGAVTGAVPRM